MHEYKVEDLRVHGHKGKYLKVLEYKVEDLKVHGHKAKDIRVLKYKA